MVMEQIWIIFSGLLLIALALGLLAWSIYLFQKERLRIEHTSLVDKRLVPLQLQAYERLVLFLERSDLNTMVLRLNQANMTARMLHVELLKQIRQEFEHNLVQQLYVSDGLWELICSAKEKNIQVINLASDRIKKDAPAFELSKQILSSLGDGKKQPNKIALIALKQEKRKRFGR